MISIRQRPSMMVPQQCSNDCSPASLNRLTLAWLIHASVWKIKRSGKPCSISLPCNAARLERVYGCGFGGRRRGRQEQEGICMVVGRDKPSPYYTALGQYSRGWACPCPRPPRTTMPRGHVPALQYLDRLYGWSAAGGDGRCLLGGCRRSWLCIIALLAWSLENIVRRVRGQRLNAYQFPAFASQTVHVATCERAAPLIADQRLRPLG